MVASRFEFGFGCFSGLGLLPTTLEMMMMMMMPLGSEKGINRASDWHHEWITEGRNGHHVHGPFCGGL